MANNTVRALNSQYADLGQSTKRLASGLRINSSADDAAGLAIRELQRADIRTLAQGVRNANDAVSMIQTADGALSIIDEKLIRMKELAEQASTGTYDSTQRLMIDSEFQEMAREINRIANATDFNGVHLLNGNLYSEHNGSKLNSTGSAKIHFGTGNDAKEDYYYVGIADVTLRGLGLGEPLPARNITRIDDILTNGAGMTDHPSGIVSFAYVPVGTVHFRMFLDDHGRDDTIQIFTATGQHLAGTIIGSPDWASAGVANITDMETKVITNTNGFKSSTYDGTQTNGVAANLQYDNTPPYNQFTVNGMNFGYSGNGNPVIWFESLTIDKLTEDLVVVVSGAGRFSAQAAWDFMPSKAINQQFPNAVRIETQQHAQIALGRIDNAIVIKDSVRANLGALQNRLENTISNLNIQAENLQASESRISDTDVAIEMTEFVSKQIKTQAAVAMLAQANSLPKMALQIMGG